jgi:plastocyanin
MEPTLPTTTSSATPPRAPKKIPRWLIAVTIGLVVLAVAVAAWMMWTNITNQAAEETPTAMVAITDVGFSPATLKIQKGQDVTWTNQTNAPQHLVADEGQPQGFQTSEALDNGDTYTFTFEDAGTYNYHNPNNIDHKGVIVVEE